MQRNYFLAKLFVPLIKEVFVHNFRQFSENWFFEGISTGADLTKMVKICIILICANKIFFGKIIYSTHQKKVFVHNFRQFSENWIFEGISTGADLTKMVKICIISICAKKIFFGKIIYSTHQRKCFSTMLRNFWKIEFLKEYRQARTLKKWWKFVLSQFVLRKYFLAKLFVPLIKESFSPQCYNDFWKIEFLKEYRQARTLQKWWKCVLSQFVLRKYFLAKLSIPLIKESVSPQFTQFLENWIFEGISTGADLKKMVKICIISICAKKIFFGKIIYSTHQRKCFSTILGNFWKIEFLKEYRQARTLQKWWIFVLS